MSTRNSQKHFRTGIGVYSPWPAIDPRVQAAQTAQVPKRKFEYKRGVMWKDGKLVDVPKAKDNRRVRVRGPRPTSGWLQPQPMKMVYFTADKGWRFIPF